MIIKSGNTELRTQLQSAYLFTATALSTGTHDQTISTILSSIPKFEYDKFAALTASLYPSAVLDCIAAHTSFEEQDQMFFTSTTASMITFQDFEVIQDKLDQVQQVFTTGWVQIINALHSIWLNDASLVSCAVDPTCLTVLQVQIKQIVQLPKWKNVTASEVAGFQSRRYLNVNGPAPSLTPRPIQDTLSASTSPASASTSMASPFNLNQTPLSSSSMATPSTSTVSSAKSGEAEPDDPIEWDTVPLAFPDGTFRDIRNMRDVRPMAFRYTSSSKDLGKSVTGVVAQAFKLAYDKDFRLPTLADIDILFNDTKLSHHKHVPSMVDRAREKVQQLIADNIYDEDALEVEDGVELGDVNPLNPERSDPHTSGTKIIL